jgi:hypothetical protein
MKERSVHDFVEGVRALAMEQGVTEHGLFCERCGKFVVPMHTVEYLCLCPQCRQYELTEHLKDMRPGRSRVKT